MADRPEREPRRPVFGQPVDWAKMTPEQKKEWALGLIRKVKAAGGPEKVLGKPAT